YGGLVSFGTAISSMGPLGAGLFGFFNRLLIPTGLHHALNSVFTSFWKNKYLIMATLINGLMILAVLFIPVLNDLFKLGTLD
ncbi:hypothetical protein PT111_09115, partial [Erysipelothrix rhusiopathiae]|nr:hypothetical protein [Erysipelothrix rhusiopathiae]